MSAVNPKVSIVIPVYNGSDFLSEAIDSALAQTYRNIEIVVVNDGSQDDGKTERVALSYGSRIRYFSKPNGGVASALNLAIREMAGEYLSWLSHDDLYDANKIEQEVDALREAGWYKGLIIYSDYSVFTDRPDAAVPVHMAGVPPEHFRYWLTAENKNMLHGCTLLIPRSAFESCGGFNEDLRTTQDYDLWFRLAELYRFVHIKKVLVKARSHPEQGSNTMSNIALRECNSLMAHFIRELTTVEISAASKGPIFDAYLRMASNMRWRGLENAADVAESLASASSPSRFAYTGYLVKKRFARWSARCADVARKSTSARARRIIKNLLRLNH
ncbi:MAG: glycosyltransferase [Thiobacillus sp.]|nr:glycosyltransferase [Thiobacillus sp.]